VQLIECVEVAVRNGELDRPLVRDASPSETKRAISKTAKEGETLKSNDWYEKAALSISAARKRNAKSRSVKSEELWSMRRIRGFS
jgi:hypothetical protein